MDANFRAYLPGDDYRLSFIPQALLFIDDLDPATVYVAQLLLGLIPVNKNFKMPYTDLKELTRCSVRSLQRSVSILVKIGFLIRKGIANKKCYELDLRALEDKAAESPRWIKYAHKCRNTFIPFTLPPKKEKQDKEINLLDPDDPMQRDAEDILNTKSAHLKERLEINKRDSLAYVNVFYTELSVDCVNKFKSLYSFLKFQEGGDPLYNFVLKIREIGNPHLVSRNRFEKALDDYIKAVNSGKIAVRKAVTYKRNTLMAYFKNIKRPKFAVMLKHCSPEVADKLAGDPSFKKLVSAIFKADKDPNYGYKEYLWCVVNAGKDNEDVPYVPMPYKDDHLYKMYAFYDEVHK